jgi:hypothetical protein
MASLTETAYYTRRTINWAILGVIGYFILRLLLSLGIQAYLAVFPPKAPPPNHGFGILPPVVFPEEENPVKLTYALQTITGTVPAASQSATVYLMPKKPASLLALTQTQSFASKLQFDPTPHQETNSIYRFDDSQFPLRKLRYDIVSNNFIVRYTFESDTSVFNNKNTLSESEAIALARQQLVVNQLDAPEYLGGKTSITFLKLKENELIETTSQSQSDAVRVDFYRKNIGDTSVVTPRPKEGPISFVFSGALNFKQQTLQFAYANWPIDYNTTATYELKTSNQAWEELKAGQGYIAQLPVTGSTNVTVRDIYLAYYDTYDQQPYLQPIFVFEGDDGFVAYVPAIAPAWTKN